MKIIQIILEYGPVNEIERERNIEKRIVINATGPLETIGPLYKSDAALIAILSDFLKGKVTIRHEFFRAKNTEVIETKEP